jgi:sulfatase maturation enzyme AslB (radical SAM superfamily)
MRGNHFSIILLPTNKCNVNCDYCFEDKTRDNMPMEKLSILIDKVLDHMERSHVGALTIYWQGGEIMTMPGLPKVPAAEGMAVRRDRAASRR